MNHQNSSLDVRRSRGSGLRPPLRPLLPLRPPVRRPPVLFRHKPIQLDAFVKAASLPRDKKNPLEFWRGPRETKAASTKPFPPPLSSSFVVVREGQESFIREEEKEEEERSYGRGVRVACSLRSLASSATTTQGRGRGRPRAPRLHGGLLQSARFGDSDPVGDILVYHNDGSVSEIWRCTQCGAFLSSRTNRLSSWTVLV